MADVRLQRPLLPYVPDQYDAENEAAFRREVGTLVNEVDSALVRLAESLGGDVVPHKASHETGGGDELTDLSAAIITAGVLVDGRVQESNVTQHETALTITEAQISDLNHNPGNTTSVSGAYTILSTDDTVLANANGAAFTVTLPPAASVTDQKFTVKKTDSSANAVTLDGDGAETIDGASSISLDAQYEAYTVQSDGATWWII